MMMGWLDRLLWAAIMNTLVVVGSSMDLDIKKAV